MSLTDKIVMLADAIEETRDFPGVETLRDLAMKSLDAAVLTLTDQTLLYLVQKGRLIDPRLLELRNVLLKTSVSGG
jgi:HD superfamily phosphohydrolase YqeK